MAKGIHTEETFEQAIEEHLLEHGGYIRGEAANFDPRSALDRETLLAFLKETQPKNWERIQTIHGAQAEDKVVNRLVKVLDQRGLLDVLRKGFTDYGVQFDLAYFRPETSLNPDTERLYGLNRLTVTRQVHYSTKYPRKSLDMLLSINGLPVVSIELKNQFTGQSVEDAKEQYRYDRDFREPLFQFKRGALVHFAVDSDEAYMTTRLKGKDTYYLPFNKGHDNGAGNPPNPYGYSTAYLWEDIWTKDSLMEIIGRFVHLQTEEIKIGGKVKNKEILFFPRYHQLDAVRELHAHVKHEGAGTNYLIQHSAGSGKSKTIAWLSYRLSSLHDARDKRIFHSVVVVTDRRVLDQQLQDTIYQIEHKQGVVQKIDKHSSQLAEALEKGANIIITTLQKFPYVIGKIGDLPARRYAVIVDEAHSSQGGETSKQMKEVLAGASLEEAARQEADTEEDDAQEEVIRSMKLRGKQDNLSFFAFTATPKHKTLELFGVKGEDGKPRPFHLYSMRQAIEEGFILDVLQNYTTYKTYFKLSKAIEDDPEVNKKKAAKAIARFLSLHPHNLAQKTEVMVEHFRQVVRHKIGGQAKAMVVTRSRLHAVRYKRELDRYIRENGYTDIKTLVAFSGTVVDDGVSFTEPEMNKFGMKELPKKFGTDEYQLLIVADKYQTGFDQPLLHTMYVDKVLSGVRAVQTLSRLNRTHPGKEDTFVLDFVNERQTILDSFQPYYEITTVDETTDPNHLYDLKNQIESHQVIWQSEIENFAKVFFREAHALKAKDQAQLYAAVQPAEQRFRALSEEEQDEFKNSAQSFVRLYSFLSQIMPFHDAELEKLFPYLRFLLKKLPKRDQSERFYLSDEVALEYYRLQKVEEGNIELEKYREGELSGTKEAGIRKSKEEHAPLSEIIKVLNEKLGKDFTDADRLVFEQMKEDMARDDSLALQAKNNTFDNFMYTFKDRFLDVLISRMEQNESLFTTLIDDDRAREIAEQIMARQVYEDFRKQVR